MGAAKTPFHDRRVRVEGDLRCRRLRGGAIVDVPTGELRFGRGQTHLIAYALGSCVAVALYDPDRRVGGLAHVMLPGKAPPEETSRGHGLRYAVDAIHRLLRGTLALGGRRRYLRAFAAGGGNVLRCDDDTICRDNIRSVLEVLAQLGLEPCAQSLGGEVRRWVRLEVDVGVFVCVEDNGPEIVLWPVGDPLSGAGPAAGGGPNRIPARDAV